MKLFEAIHNAAIIDTTDFHDDQITTAIADIQDILGQEDGGVAGVHFCGLEEEWSAMSYEQRIDALKKYVNAELSYFEGHFEFQEQPKGK